MYQLRDWRNPKSNFLNIKYLITTGILVVLTGVSIINIYLATNMNSDHAETIHQTQASLDLLKLTNWDYNPLIKTSNGNLKVIFNRSAIAELHTGKYLANYPINLAGPIIDTKTDFELNIGMSDISGEAGIILYGVPPIIFDENRFDQSSLIITINGDKIWIGKLRGGNIGGQNERNIGIQKSNNHRLTLIKQKKLIILLVDGKYITEFSEKDIIAKNKLWLGFDVGKSEDSWRLSELQMQSMSNSSPHVEYSTQKLPAHLPGQGFKQLSAKSRSNLLIGTAISAGPLVSDEQYYQIAGGWYNSWTTENALKMQFVHPQKDIYSFGEADLIVDLAKKNQVKVHGHALVFGEANPSWINQLAINNPDALEQAMIDHIKNVVGHFKSKVDSWDVVNEPLSDYESYPLRKHIWNQAMGEAYIQKALIAANETDPSADLYINEYGLEKDGERWDYFLSLVDKLKAQNIPIHGVGFQAHVYEPGDEINPEIMKKHFKQLEARGLKVRVSEMDVYGSNSQLQANQFADVLRVCKESANCVSFNTWGITEKYGSTSIVNQNSIEVGDGLLFDSEYKTFKAVSAIQAILKR